MGYAMVRGRFANFSGTLRYDEKDQSKTSVTLSIEVASIDTDNDWRDKDLKSDNWFDAEKYPTIKFQSTQAVATNSGLKVKGNLTIKDVTKEVVLQLENPSGVLNDMRDDAQVVFSGGLTIYRTDYHVQGENWSKVKEGITGVEKEIKIEFTILAKQIKENNYRNWVRNEKTPQGKIFGRYEAHGVQAGIEEFERLFTEDSENITAGALNTVGYMLLKMGKVDEALKIFERNIKAFPDNANVYDSYAEACAHKNFKKARENYEKALSLDPSNINAEEILRNLPRK
jgi:polyisoprenoid-binding protein YceI